MQVKERFTETTITVRLVEGPDVTGIIPSNAIKGMIHDTRGRYVDVQMDEGVDFVSSSFGGLQFTHHDDNFYWSYNFVIFIKDERGFMWGNRNYNEDGTKSK